jgi:phosphoglycerate dehydrogenase-like enzyme
MNSPPRLKAIPAGNADNLALVYDQKTRASLSRKIALLLPWPEAGEPKKEPVEWPEETEALFGTWGMPPLTPEVLERLPNLKVLFYGAGSVKSLLSDQFYRKGIRVFTGAQGNAVPVAEYALAQILLHLKGISHLRVRSRADWRHCDATSRHAYPGNYRSRIGLVSYGAIARILRDRLRAFDHEVFVWDPYLSREEADREEIVLVSRETLFRDCHAVSIHTPLLKETRGMLGYEEILSMRRGGILINTSRGAVFDQHGLARALAERPDLVAVLDVLEKEPPEENDPILALPNVHITPHVAGSMGPECARIGSLMDQACEDYLVRRPSPLEVRREDLHRMA